MTFGRDYTQVPIELKWLNATPAHWNIDRLKWSISGIFNGVWGDEPNVLEDIICVRVADFDRTRFKVVNDPPTIRAVAAKDRTNRVLQKGDLLIEKSGGGDNQPVGCVVHFDHDYDAVCSNFVGRMPISMGMHPRFWSYMHAFLYEGRLNIPAIKQTTGIQNLDTDVYFNLKVPFPPFSEQCIIADYLDHQTTKIDALIAAKEQLLELLAEKRRALITHAVTRGIDPNDSLRDSGIPWIGKIPEHWETERTKWLFIERDERSETGEEEMLTVSHITGVTPRSEKNVNMFEAETNEGYKVCYAGDLVINTLWAWMGAMGVSPMHGIVSPAYHIYTPCERLDPAYVDALVRIPMFAQEVIRFSKGVWSSRLRLYPEGLYKICLPVPPLDEQRAIVSHIAIETKKLDALREAAERTIALSKERRAALIAAAVTGEIEVGDAP